ncbi:pyridoxamine 5'-phosphate oxidase family protein [Massilia horti]|uniref:General stress protein FMN-binding split barrel domain-containing protein n=1 Tax=Massilia horti TaxID=2562153 RepID=A0A4Y9TA32_9BURK|nr:pyridoxamine 5'-phosphate oxidase family protein [Massilia horti]TFW35391.1 hypothetical protein E4O92_02285 [Massilia horti]
MATLNDYAHVAELTAKIHPVRFAMFTTVAANGHLVSQPMTLQKTDDKGGLWFYTSTLTALWENIAHRPEVNLAFAKPVENLYVSVSGCAERVVDRAQVRNLWSASVALWLPGGPDDDHSVLVRIAPHSAEYWDANQSAMVRMFHLARAAVTGKGPASDQGGHGTISL